MRASAAAQQQLEPAALLPVSAAAQLQALARIESHSKRPAMTLEQVLEKAAQMDPGERWKSWLACGLDRHSFDSLPRTETGGSPPPYYCPRCWTAFTYTGAVLNPPKEKD